MRTVVFCLLQPYLSRCACRDFSSVCDKFDAPAFHLFCGELIYYFRAPPASVRLRYCAMQFLCGQWPGNVKL
jgi:hypothetical protein